MRYMLLCSRTQLEIQPSRRGSWETRKPNGFQFSDWLNSPSSINRHTSIEEYGEPRFSRGKSKAHFPDSRGSNVLKTIFNKYNMHSISGIWIWQAEPGSLCTTESLKAKPLITTMQCVVGMLGVFWWVLLWLELGSNNYKKTMSMKRQKIFKSTLNVFIYYLIHPPSKY